MLVCHCNILYSSWQIVVSSLELCLIEVTTSNYIREGVGGLEYIPVLHYINIICSFVTYRFSSEIRLCQNNCRYFWFGPEASPISDSAPESYLTQLTELFAFTTNSHVCCRGSRLDPYYDSIHFNVLLVTRKIFPLTQVSRNSFPNSGSTYC